jgi:hypothetical protein
MSDSGSSGWEVVTGCVGVGKDCRAGTLTAGFPSLGKMGGGSVAGGADSVGTLRVGAAGGLTGGTFTVPPGLMGKFGGGRVSGNACASVKVAFSALQALAC